jgi:hypothetical protein
MKGYFVSLLSFERTLLTLQSHVSLLSFERTTAFDAETRVPYLDSFMNFSNLSGVRKKF